jgi:predicted glycosyltransferase
MLDQDDLWLMEELPVEEPSELLRTMPEIRQYLEPERTEEVGLRSILERPEALSKAWCHANTRRRTYKGKRHRSTVLRAA